MTSIGIGNQFNELVKVTLSEKQAMTDQTDNNVQMIDESAKSQDFFQDNNPPGKKTIQRELNQGIFFLILHILELIRKISTTIILFLMSICSYQELESIFSGQKTC